jgi:general stress protein 26
MPTQKPLADSVSTDKKLDELYGLIEGIEIAMLTTIEPDGSLTSRPMATQKRREGVDLWFMTSNETHKTDALRAHPQVNVAYYNQKSREWVSVSGIATLSRDRALIHEVYEKDWKAWLGDEGGERDGGPDDPRILLIEIEAQEATYMKSNTPRVIALFKVMKALATGGRVELGDVRHVDGSEFEAGDR